MEEEEEAIQATQQAARNVRARTGPWGHTPPRACCFNPACSSSGVSPPPPLPPSLPSSLPEAVGADEQASAEFFDWLDDEAARGAELRELLRGPQRAPATELTEAELLQLAAADEAMELAPREKLELTKVRQKCGQLGRMVGLSPLESANRHAFKLVIRDGKRLAVCLHCEARSDYEPTATGKGERFLSALTGAPPSPPRA